MYKRTSIIITLALVTLLGCKKDPDPVSYFLKATINGTLTQFNYPAYADTILGSNYTSTVVSGTLGGSDHIFSFTFRSNSQALLVPGTYTGTNTYILTVTLVKGSLSKFYSNQGNANFTVVVQTVNNTYVEGTFSGTLKEASNAADILTVTDGSFKCAFIH